MKKTLLIFAALLAFAAVVCLLIYAALAIKFAFESVDDVSTTIINDFSSKNTFALATDVPLALPRLKRAVPFAGARDRRYYALYVCYVQRGEMQKASNAIQSAYRLSPMNPTYAMFCGLSLKLQGRNREARDFYVQQERRNGHSLTWGVMIAATDMSIQDYADARSMWEKLLRETPNISPLDKSVALSQLGECYLYRGNRGAAIDYLRQSIASVPTVTNHTLLGEALLKSREPRQSIDEFDLALKQNRYFDRALFLKGVALSTLGDDHSANSLFNDALASVNARLRVVGDEGENYYLRGMIEDRLGESDAAQNSYECARKLEFTYDAPYAPLKYGK